MAVFCNWQNVYGIINGINYTQNLNRIFHKIVTDRSLDYTKWKTVTELKIIKRKKAFGKIHLQMKNKCKFRQLKIEEVTCPFLEVGRGCPERVTSCPRNRILSSRQHCWYLSLRTFAGLEEKNHPSHHYHHLIESVTLQGFA